ncbi:MAG: hypothetical protein HGA22_01830 [Clostridiales bacterium]|nr:hypothetical protein [Clostridiales bacterium]
MGLGGVYKVMVAQFESYYAMELHIKQEYRGIYASLKDGVLTRTFYDGSVNGGWDEKSANSFYFASGQIDEYVDIPIPGGSPDTADKVNLTPPGGYHAGGVIFAGTVLGDAVTGVIILKNNLVCSVTGRRIEGEPSVIRKIRTDIRAGVNRYCTCGTGSCTHHGFCDSCNMFESIHCTPPLDENGALQFPDMPAMHPGEGHIPAAQCMNEQQDKLFGPVRNQPPKPKFNSDGTPFREHGPHHLKEEAGFIG